MPRSSKQTIASILDAGFKLFFSRGFARVSMDDIAAAAGVTKRTLYYHFASKDDLVGAVLDRQNEQSLKAFQKWADPELQMPGAFVESLFEGLLKWASRERWTGSGFTRLSMELADLPGHPARIAAKKHKLAVQAWLAGELQKRGVEDSTAASVRIAILLEGAVTLSFILDDRAFVSVSKKLALEQIAQN